MLRQIAREPLVHFIFLGGLLFAAWSWLAPPEAAGPDQDVIVLDQARRRRTAGICPTLRSLPRASLRFAWRPVLPPLWCDHY